MKLSNIVGSSVEEMRKDTNLIIASSGYETRSRAIISLVGDAAEKRIALSFGEQSTAFDRKKNDEEFVKNGFELRPCSGKSTSEIRELIRKDYSRVVDPGQAIAIDISSMTRVWYGAFIRGLLDLSVDHRIETYFVYVPGKYRPAPLHSPPNEVVGPVEGFASLLPPDMPVALVLGMGYVPETALGLREVLDPRLTVLMFPGEGSDDGFFELVRKNNQELLARTPAEWVFEYPAQDPVMTFRMLESMCGGLEKEFRIVMAGLGHKLFGVLCFLIAGKYPQVSIWRVNPGSWEEPRNVVPAIDRVVVFKVTWYPG